MNLGDRVYVAGNVGRYGYLTVITRDPSTSPYYMVRFDGDIGHSGPFTEVWPAMLTPDPRERV